MAAYQKGGKPSKAAKQQEEEDEDDEEEDEEEEEDYDLENFIFLNKILDEENDE